MVLGILEPKEVELNVAILPPHEVRDIAIDMSRKLRERFKTDFVIDGQRFLPHVTVYRARYPKKNVDAVINNLKVIAGKITPFELTFGKIAADGSFIFWNAEMTNDFLHLQKSVLYQLNALREGLVLEELRNVKFDMSQMFDIQNYGSLLVKEGGMQPHVTLTHMSDRKEALLVHTVLNPRIARFTATEMHIGAAGKFGTLTGIDETFQFGAARSPYMF